MHIATISIIHYLFNSAKVLPLVANLNQDSAGGNGVVVDGVLAAGEDGIALATEALADLDLKATVDRIGLDKDRSSDGNKSGIDGGIAVGTVKDAV